MCGDWLFESNLAYCIHNLHWWHLFFFLKILTGMWFGICLITDASVVPWFQPYQYCDWWIWCEQHLWVEGHKLRCNKKGSDFDKASIKKSGSITSSNQKIKICKWQKKWQQSTMGRFVFNQVPYQAATIKPKYVSDSEINDK